MKKPANWIGLIVTPLIFSILFFQKCEKPVYKDSKSDKFDSLNSVINGAFNKIDSLESIIDKKQGEVKVEEKEVGKLKKKKGAIRYDIPETSIDTTLLNDLINCDSIAKIADTIIQKQDTIINKQKDIIKDKDAISQAKDTIIQDQRVIIDELDLDNQELTKEVKRQKRKMVFTKILSGAVILGIILISL